MPSHPRNTGRRGVSTARQPLLLVLDHQLANAKATDLEILDREALDLPALDPEPPDRDSANRHGPDRGGGDRHQRQGGEDPCEVDLGAEWLHQSAGNAWFISQQGDVAVRGPVAMISIPPFGATRADGDPHSITHLCPHAEGREAGTCRRPAPASRCTRVPISP